MRIFNSIDSYNVRGLHGWQCIISAGRYLHHDDTGRPFEYEIFPEDSGLRYIAEREFDDSEFLYAAPEVIIRMAYTLCNVDGTVVAADIPIVHMLQRLERVGLCMFSSAPVQR